MGPGIRGRTGTKDQNEHVSRDDVWISKGKNGNHKVMEDYEKDAEGGFATCAYGCYGGF